MRVRCIISVPKPLTLDTVDTSSFGSAGYHAKLTRCRVKHGILHLGNRTITEESHCAIDISDNCF
jgi:hypothetical protein